MTLEISIVTLTDFSKQDVSKHVLVNGYWIVWFEKYIVILNTEYVNIYNDTLMRNVD